MSKAKLQRKSKSKPSSPRLYEMDDLAKFMQPLLQTRNGYQESKVRRPKSEILRELRRLRAVSERPADYDEEEEETVAPPLVKSVRTLEQLDSLRLTRHRIIQLLRSNTFDQAVCHCFVRLNINAFNVPPEYRIAEILGVEKLPEGYYVDKTPTNIVLHLRYEDLIEKHELNDISNMAFTREEFQFWCDNCICQAFEWPTTELIARKKIELYNALNSEGQLISILQQKCHVPIPMPMRPTPRGGLLERIGGVYPWKLQRPSSSSALEVPSQGASASAKPELELEALNEKQEAQLLDSITSSAES